MRKISLILLFFILSSSFSLAYIGTPGVDFVPNELIVKFKSSANIQSNTQAKAFAQSLSQESISNSQKAFPVIRKINTVGLERIYVIDFNPNADLEKIITAYKKNPNIEYTEPNWYGEPQATPNDPNYPDILTVNQSGLRSLTPERGWDYTTGSPIVIIAEPDSGISIIENGTPFTNQEFLDKIYINTKDPINGIDDDNNGCIDDYYGCDINLYDGKNLSDLSTISHGTRIAGILAANTNNTIGIAGTCWNCKILLIKISTPGDIRTDLSVSRGVRWAIDNNANIISMSTGFSTNSSLLSDSASDADRNDIIYVAAAGNQNNNPSLAAIYPGSYITVLGIAGLFDNETKWISTSSLGSNYGAWVDVSAPAFKVISTLRNGNIGVPNSGLSGTSFAAPFVAGEAGLILSRWPSLSKKQVEYIIKDAVDNINDSNPGFEGLLGTGRINITKAMEFGCSDKTFLRSCSTTKPYYCDFDSNNLPVLSINISMCGWCQDTDGGIVNNTAGNVTYFDQSGALINNQDTCQSKNTLIEYYCASNISASTSISCSTGTECRSGECTKLIYSGGSPFIFKRFTVSEIPPIEQSPQIFGFLVPISRFLRFLIPAL